MLFYDKALFAREMREFVPLLAVAIIAAADSAGVKLAPDRKFAQPKLSYTEKRWIFARTF